MLRWEGFAEKESFKPEMKMRGSNGIVLIIGLIYTIRHDTICYFNVRSKVSLIHAWNQQLKSGKRRTKK